MDLSKIYEVDDEDKYEKLNEKRSKQWIRLYQKITIARDKGDEQALRKAQEAMIKHEQKDKIFKAKAEKAGFDWL